MVFVFKIPQGEKIYSLKRGFLNAQIASIAFSQNSTLIGLTSNRGTLHIFELERMSKQSLTTVNPEIELKDSEDPAELKDQDKSTEGCCGIIGLQYIFTKFSGLFFNESDEYHSSTINLLNLIVKSIIKERDDDFSKEHIIALDEHGKVTVIWKNGCVREFGFNRIKRTIEKTNNTALSNFVVVEEINL